MPSSSSPEPLPRVGVSVVVAVKDEVQAIVGLIAEIVAAMGPGDDYEIVIVDDGSTDGTLAALKRVQARESRLHPGTDRGALAAVCTGVRSARGALIVTLDGDGQNDPADIPRLLAAYRAAAPGERIRLVTGRRAQRRDVWIKRVSSRVANAVRGWVLNDRSRDSACGLKVVDREVFLQLPYFNHMHRFLPALVRREGYEVLAVDVNHRHRATGVSKYGTWDRLLAGIVDLAGVAWLQARRAAPEIIEP